MADRPTDVRPTSDSLQRGRRRDGLRSETAAVVNVRCTVCRAYASDSRQWHVFSATTTRPTPSSPIGFLDSLRRALGETHKSRLGSLRGLEEPGDSYRRRDIVLCLAMAVAIGATVAAVSPASLMLLRGSRPVLSAGGGQALEAAWHHRRSVPEAFQAWVCRDKLTDGLGRSRVHGGTAKTKQARQHKTRGSAAHAHGRAR